MWKLSVPGPKPSTVTVQRGVVWKSILIIGLLIAGLSLLAALPLSFFFNGNMGDWFGNMPLDLIPPPEQLPENWDQWEIPGDWQPPDIPWNETELPDWLNDYLNNLPDNWTGELPPGDIPWWVMAGALGYLLAGGSIPGGGGVGPDGGVGGLPGMGGSMGNGLGPFGTGNTTVWVSSNLPWHYWRLRSYDFFTGHTWVVSDGNTSEYQPEIKPGVNYTVIYRVEYAEEGYGNLPLTTLWDKPMIFTDLVVLNESGLPAENITWNLLEDPYGGVFWNASIRTPGTYYIAFNVTVDESVSIPAIESNVYSASPLTFRADPPDTHDYLQLPDLSNYSDVLADMQAIASNPAIATNNTYETAKAVMEYFKTRWWWTPYREQVPGQDFDPGYLIRNGYGASHDFASNFVLYLRYLNISSRLVWGGIGYQNDTYASTQFGIPVMRLSHSHFWAEVWIPNATNTGGSWVQFDPNPIPPTMWQPNASNPNEMIEIDARRNDTRVETSHYTMLFNSSVAYNVPQTRGSSFNLIGSLIRDGKTITKTWLNEPITYTYMDVTDNLLVGQASGSISHAFDANSQTGPHRFNASFHAVQNETIVTCNGTTIVRIESLSPHLIERGPGDAFTVVANISDPATHRPITGVELKGWVVDISRELPDNLGQQVTDANGSVTSEYSFPSDESVGVYNFTMNFTGTFVVDYPEPYPDYAIPVPGSASQSQNETITVIAGINITLTTSGQGDYLPRGHNITFTGFLTFDNGTGLGGRTVNVWWVNSTGTYNIISTTTAPNGFYQGFHWIPTDYNDPTNGNDVLIYANFSAVWGNATTDPTHTYHVRCSNWTNIVLNTDVGTFSYVIRDQTSIHVWGTLWDTQGVASTANQPIEIRVYETWELVDDTIITDANGNFDAYVQIPNSQAVGNYNLCAVFPGNWYFEGGFVQINILSSAATSAMNNSHEFLVVAATVLTKTSNPNDIGRVVTPTPMIAGDPVYVSGYLLYDNGTPLQSQEVKAWWFKSEGTEIEMGSNLTDATGFYNITYIIPMFEPTDVIIKVNYSAGSLMDHYILNASTTEDPELVWAVNVSINSVTPAEAIRGITQVHVSGRVIEKHGWLTPNEMIYLTLDGQNILDQNNNPVTATTDSLGYFSVSFVINENYPLGANYVMNATLTNTSFVLNEVAPSYLEVNCTTSIIDVSIASTALIGENFTISGKLVDNMNQNINGNVSLLVNGSLIYSEYVQSGQFTWNLMIPNDPIYAGMANITVWHNGSTVTYPSFAQLWQNVPKGADVAITNIAGMTDFSTNLTLFTGSTITISGKLTDNESSEVIFNRLVELYYNNTLIGSGLTDANGEFHIQITLPSVVGNTTIYARFAANNVYLSEEISVQIVLPQGIGEIIMQYLPWILGIALTAVGGVVGYKIYKRRIGNGGIRKIKFKGLNLENIKLKLSALEQGKRYREAIIFAYHNYLKALQGYFSVTKRPSQTAREFAIKVVKEAKIPPPMIYPFTNLYEEARFGPREVNATKYKEALQLFLNLYTNIEERAKTLVPQAAEAA